MNFTSALVWGLWATVALSVLQSGAQKLALSRISLPFLLGTMVTGRRDLALAIGTVFHFSIGLSLAAIYALTFESLGTSNWWIGAALGMLHALVLLLALFPAMPGVHPRMASESSGPKPTRALEPPGMLGFNYGRATAVIMIVAHVAYGVIIGSGYEPASRGGDCAVRHAASSVG